MSSYLGIGVMSGTSLDGMDLVACTFSLKGKEDISYTINATDHVAYSEQWVARLAHLMEQNAETYARTHVYYGHLLGETIRDFMVSHHLAPAFVAVHGHTIFHQPERNLTAQIGEGETLVSYLNCPLVTNFRAKDIALGGQGAPLVPMGEKYLFPQYEVFLNLGGFANISAKGVACDIAPCNTVMNFLASNLDASLAYDPEGRIAASGTLDSDLLATLNALPFYRKPPPKSLGWEWITDQVMPLLEASSASIPDQLHTFAHHISIQIREMLEQLGVSHTTMWVSGGGGHNAFLMNLLAKELLPLRISLDQQMDELLGDFKEALIFAFLGLRTLIGTSTVLPSATGVPWEALTGSIHLPPKPSGKNLLELWK